MGAAGGGDLAGLDLGAHAAARKLGRRAAGHRLDRRRDRRDDRDMPGIRAGEGRGGVEAVDVGEQHQQVGAGHGGDAGGEPVIVAIADFGGCDGIVLVDHRNGAQIEQAAQGRTGVEIAPAFFGVGEGEQDLAGIEPVMAERFRPVAGKRDLADRCRSLAFLEPERAGRQLQHGAAERDRAG